jgi:hypothetical protein
MDSISTLAVYNQAKAVVGADFKPARTLISGDR